MENNLLTEIEKYRKKMISRSETHAFTSDEVVEVSQQLDHLLNLHAANTKEMQHLSH